jgi:hypothetical protein
LLKNRLQQICFLITALASISALLVPQAGAAAAAAAPPSSLTLAAGWRLQDVAKIPQSGAQVSSPSFDASGWYVATVPGTVLTTLVNDHVYAEPLYGENERPEIIPESLVHTSYWYRTVVRIPSAYTNRRVWLNFDGINYSAEVWVNGAQVGTMRGAFVRGIFDVTAQVTPGQQAVVAVLVTPEPHPGVPHEHTLRNGVGQNGGITALDGPTFLSTIGWDWLDAVRDRDTGIWQKVFLSTTGPVVVKDPLVTTDLPLPKTDSSDVTVETTVENVSDEPVAGVVRGAIENIVFERQVTLAPHSSQQITFDATNTPALHIDHPRLWWPSGYGAQPMYKLHLEFRTGEFRTGSAISDAKDVEFGVRKISYSVPGTDTLTISVNGVPIFIRGGDWGLDEALKRNPRARLDAEIRLHKLANLNLIRNWVGQSTGEDFYELCDKYGLLVWDEFFQPNPLDGPDPTDIPTYIANVRNKVLRYRNHPSIVLWCARNEGDPPPEIDAALRTLLAEVDPTRLYWPNSTDGPGVRSHGPYYWRAPREFYTVTDDFFKTETGSASIPTLESIRGMMPKKDWETIDDDWAAHDLAKGNQHGDLYPIILAGRYGKFANLADFVRKAQMANFEAFRAMYEGRNAMLFHPTTAVITWMSNPAQPSFVWQIYHYDLEPMSSYFAVMHASELVHIQFNEATGDVQVINNKPEPVDDLLAHVAVYNLDGSLAYEHETRLTAASDVATDLGPIDFPASVSPVHFIKLDLRDSSGRLISTNFYWRAEPGDPDDLTALNQLPMVKLTANVEMPKENIGGQRRLRVLLHNPTQSIALMAHVQMRRKSSQRVLPVFYSDNYVSLVPGETKAIEVEAAASEFKGEASLIVVDGWNVTVAPASFPGGSIAPNLDAQPDRWPATGLPVATTGLR